MDTDCNLPQKASYPPSKDPCKQDDYTAMPANKQSSRLAKLLRSIGAASIVMALYQVLISGWKFNNDFYSYLSILGHTAALAIIAFACAHFLKETKGPRLFFMLSLLSALVNITLLGAFTLSQFSPELNIGFSDRLNWIAESPRQLLYLSLISAAALTPTVFLAYRILCRGVNHTLACLFLINSSALLLPYRDAGLIALLATALSLFSCVALYKQRANSVLKTLEGHFSSATIFLPIGLLLARNLQLYAIDLNIMMALGLLSFMVLRSQEILMDNQSTLKSCLQFSSLSSILVASTCFVLQQQPQLSVALIISAVIASAICFDIAHRNPSLANYYRLLASAILTLSQLYVIAFDNSPAQAGLLLLSSSAMIALAYLKQQKTLLLAGLGIFTLNLLTQLASLLDNFQFDQWLSLVAIGIFAILLASLLESKGTNIKLKLKSMSQQYRRWEY